MDALDGAAERASVGAGDAAPGTASAGVAPETVAPEAVARGAVVPQTVAPEAVARGAVAPERTVAPENVATPSRVRRAVLLGGAFAWRLRREGLRYLAAAFVPFIVVMTLLSVLPSATGGKAINGAADAAAFGARYGAHANAVAVGLLLIIAPGMVALFSSVGVARAVRGLVGAEVGRGGLEALLSGPFTPGVIAAALLGYTLLVATGFWAVMSGLGAAAIALTVLASGSHLALTGTYLAMALLLPLLAVWAGTALAMLVSLLLPRLTQLGATVNVAGGDLGSGVSALPAIGVLLTLVFGVSSLGPGPILAAAGAIAAVITVASVLGVALGFRPETVLDS